MPSFVAVKKVLFCGLLLALGVLLFNSQDLLIVSAEWLREQGLSGMLLYSLAYVFATVTVAPGLALAMGAGFIYGPTQGLLIIVPASIIGSMLAFFLGRTFLRNFAQKKLGAWPHYAQIEKKLAERGLFFLTLLFAYPLTPFRLLNYAVSLSTISLHRFVIVLSLSMAVHLFPFVYCGSLAGDLSQATHSSLFSFCQEMPFFTLGIFLSATLLFVLLFWCYRRMMAQN